jgi:hypothetical protein
MGRNETFVLSMAKIGDDYGMPPIALHCMSGFSTTYPRLISSETGLSSKYQLERNTNGTAKVQGKGDTTILLLFSIKILI